MPDEIAQTGRETDSGTGGPRFKSSCRQIFSCHGAACQEEIIQMLGSRKKCRVESENLRENDIVMEMEDNLPRGVWRLLRVSTQMIKDPLTL